MKHTSVFLLLLMSLLALLRFLVACSSPVSSTASGALGDSPTDRCTRMKWPVAHSFAHSFIHFIRFIRLVHSNATTPLAATSKVRQQHRTLAECSGRSACPATGAVSIQSSGACIAAAADGDPLSCPRTLIHADTRRQARQSIGTAVQSTTASLIQPPARVSPSPFCLPLPLPLRFRPPSLHSDAPLYLPLPRRIGTATRRHTRRRQ